MATAEQVKSLVKAHIENDDEKFRTVVLQIAAHEARAGHDNSARELKSQIEKITKRSTIFRFDTGSQLCLFTTPSFRIKDLICFLTRDAQCQEARVEFPDPWVV